MDLKINLKPVLVVITLIAMVLGSVTMYSAETYYIYEDYIYRDVDYNADTVAFCGTTEETESLTVPDTIGVKTVVEIDDYAFRNNTALRTIDLSQAVHLEEIGIGAFRGCTALESLTVPETVNHLPQYMLTDCGSLQSLKVNMAAGIIPDEMCNRCSSLQSFEVPASVREIRRFAFGDCTSLTRVDIPSGVTTIASSAFYNCPNLTIYCREGSYAHEYAAEHSIPVRLISTGDVNRDYTVNIDDATEIQKSLADIILFDDEQTALADVDGDGEVSISDATAVQFMIAR